jgi:ribonucleoside-diphosphate reductase alpha chain
MTTLTENANSILSLRYLQEGETPEDMFRRVANAVAEGERNFGGEDDIKEYAVKFYEMMNNVYFLPNSPTLVNAGREARGSLSACFTMSPIDTAESILQVGNDACMVEKWGGGIGFGFSNLRPKGDKISTTHGIACGPVAVMKYYSEGGILLTQGSFRSGAHMGQLHISHPDIIEFILAKTGPNKDSLKNFNISVQIPDSFMQQLKSNPDDIFPLVNPRDGSMHSTTTYQEIWDAICESAWATGDPGVVFLDRIHQTQPNPQLGNIQTSNPCGEEFLEDYGNCCLGSINLSEFVTTDGHDVDWEELEDIVELSVRFLDDVIEVNTFPMGVPKLRDINLRTRRIGLGVMGWADMLIKRGIPYDSPAAIDLADQIGDFIMSAALKFSGDLAHIRGPFPEYKESAWYNGNLKHTLIDLNINTEIGIRHSSVTTIAPTGSISRIAGTSSGIEPHFDIAWKSNILWEGIERAGLQLYDSPRIIRDSMKENADIAIKELAETTDEGVRFSILRRYGLDPNLFRTAMEIDPEAHVRMQAVWQKYTTNSVSKTINLSEESSVEEIARSFVLAYELGCKAITVYRNNSKAVQVLQSAGSPTLISKFSDPEKSRPKKLLGETTKLATGHGTLYATINSGNAHPTEVFLNLGKAGGCINTFTEALGRVLSTALSAGIDPSLLAEQLQGISCPHTAFTDGISVTSVPDALGKILADYEPLPQLIVAPVEGSSNGLIRIIAGSQNGNLCPRCGDSLVHQEGCALCRSCGYSECL